MRINAKVNVYGGILCREECRFASSCGNSLIPKEGGFIPELYEERGLVFCRSKNMPASHVNMTMPCEDGGFGHAYIDTKTNEIKSQNYAFDEE